jgi:hypothetical protein
MAGNVRAAEVYLEWCRKTITDEGILSKLKPVFNLTAMFDRVDQSIDKFVDFAKRIQEKRTIKEADWKDITNEPERLTDSTSGSQSSRLLERPDSWNSEHDPILAADDPDPDAC